MKLFVWDLHGTLEQGNERAVIDLSNQVLASHGYAQRFRDHHARQLYGLKWYQYYEHLLPQQPYVVHLQLQADSFALSNTSGVLISRYMRPSDHAMEVLEAIRTSPHRQIVLSQTVPEALPLYIKALGLQDYFSARNSYAVHAHSREASQTKTSVLRDLMATDKPEKIVVVGDADGDMQLAHDVGGISYLYAHEGYEFRSERGDHRTHDLRDVLREL